MHTIAESRMLLRAHVELPASYRLATEEFREGWDMVRTSNSARLRRKTLSHGWTFMKSADGVQQGGVGETAQLAIASALKLALRRVSENFDAAEIEQIELTHYPWFFLASVRVCPYIIEQNAVLPMSDDATPSTEIFRPARTTPTASYPCRVRAVPELRQVLTVSRQSQTSGQ